MSWTNNHNLQHLKRRIENHPSQIGRHYAFVTYFHFHAHTFIVHAQIFLMPTLCVDQQLLKWHDGYRSRAADGLIGERDVFAIKHKNI